VSELKPATPEVYNAFLQGLELDNIRLVSLKAESKVEQPKPAQTNVDIRYKPTWRNREGGFEALARYKVRFIDRKAREVQGSIEATFSLRFHSSEPMREELFVVFGDLNLKINSWPFMRELVQSTMHRLDWPPFPLPLLKPPPARRPSTGKEA
jgi:hypothetical protein